MITIRGATTVEKDNAEEVVAGTRELLKNMIEANKLDLNHIIAIFFTSTQDLTSAYPAKAARDLGITQASLMCMQEMHVVNSLVKCIRVCVFYDGEIILDGIRHVYLRNALSLRPDLTK